MLEIIFTLLLSLTFITYAMLFLAIIFAIMGGFQEEEMEKIRLYTLASKTLLIAALLFTISLLPALLY